LDVADRKNIQVIFTTHSQYAINPLPAKAVWAAIDGSAIQGKLDIRSLRSITGEINSELVIYVEDEFAKKCSEQMNRLHWMQLKFMLWEEMVQQ
jgi:AAA15 family ATPase/GTPase